MERLIRRNEYGGIIVEPPNGIHKDVWHSSVCHNLAAYEDSGLSPDEVILLKAFAGESEKNYDNC